MKERKEKGQKGSREGGSWEREGGKDRIKVRSRRATAHTSPAATAAAATAAAATTTAATAVAATAAAATAAAAIAAVSTAAVATAAVAAAATGYWCTVDMKEMGLKEPFLQQLSGRGAKRAPGEVVSLPPPLPREQEQNSD